MTWDFEGADVDVTLRLCAGYKRLFYIQKFIALFRYICLLRDILCHGPVALPYMTAEYHGLNCAPPARTVSYWP